MRQAGIRASGHQLRHAFAGELLRLGTPFSMLQELLGHTHISSTRVYIKIDLAQCGKSLTTTRRTTEMDKPPELDYQSFLAGAIRDYLDYLDHLGFRVVGPAYALGRIDRFPVEHQVESFGTIPAG
jgi:hypothetical protein